MEPPNRKHPRIRRVRRELTVDSPRRHPRHGRSAAGSPGAQARATGPQKESRSLNLHNDSRSLNSHKDSRTAGGHRSARPTRRRKAGGLLTLVLLSGIAAGGWWLWRSQPATLHEPLAAVRVGILTSSLEADALLVRRERVHLAPYGGAVQRLAADGERVRVGSQVVGITPGMAGETESPSRPQPATPSQSGTPSHTASTPTLALPAQASPAKLEYDRLASEIYAAALQLSQARYQGGDTGDYQDRLDQLALSQAELLPALRGEAEEVPRSQAPLPPDPPATGLPADPVPPSDPGVRALGTEEAGVVIYQVDGLESILTPESVADWTPSDLLGLPYPDTKAAGEDAVAEGGPLFKLVNDLSVEMLILTPASSLSSAQRATIADQGVTLAVAGRDRPLAADVVRTAEEGEHLLLHLSMPLPSQDALRLRRMRVELLLDEYEGTIVPRTAVAVRQGRTGVWVAEGSRFRFAPVRVIGGNQEEVAVEAELAPDAQVLTNPPPPDGRILAD